MDIIVISSIEANPSLVMEIAQSTRNIFHLDSPLGGPLSKAIAERIRETAEGERRKRIIWEKNTLAGKKEMAQRFPTFNQDKSTEEEKKEGNSLLEINERLFYHQRFDLHQG